MRTLNYVVLVLVLASFGFVSFGCGDDSSSPTAPSVMQEAPSVRATAPSTPVRGATPASFDADNVRPDQDPNRPGINDGKNAYNFRVEYVNGKLQLSLIRGGYEGVDWRPASLPHRRRLFSFYLCPTEPHHVGQTCYDIAKERLRFCEDPRGTGACKAKRVITLEPMPMLGYCDPDSDWIVVTAAELSDDKYNGWRNAPCPRQNGVTTSDGVGHGWPTTYDPYPKPEPEPEPTPTPTPEPTPTPMPEPEPEPTPMPEPMPEPEPTPMPEPMPENELPTIQLVDAGGRSRILDGQEWTYEPGQSIVSLTIVATDTDGPEPVNITVEGLPDGLTAGRVPLQTTTKRETVRVSGTIFTTVRPQLYTVFVAADDGYPDRRPQTISFGIRVVGEPALPTIQVEDQTFIRRQTMVQPIAFTIVATDPYLQLLTLEVTGIPTFLNVPGRGPTGRGAVTATGRGTVSVQIEGTIPPLNVMPPVRTSDSYNPTVRVRTEDGRRGVQRQFNITIRPET